MNLFPFDTVRAGQKEFMDAAKKAIESETPLIVHAPTGIGKTAASLAPAISYALENKKKVLFLTPRHAQHKIVIETLRMIKEKYDKNIKVVDLVGKKWLCGLPEVEYLSASEFSDYCKHKRKEKTCELYKNTYPKKEGELSEEAKTAMKYLDRNIMHSDDAKEKCVGLCPYEIFTRRAKSADIIIADYFHMFHPKIKNAFLNKIKTDVKNIILVVDEAHNLPSRARALLSTRLTDNQLMRASNEAKDIGFEEIAEDLEYLKTKFIKFAKKTLGNKDEVRLKKESLLDIVESIRGADELIEYLEKIAQHVHELKKKSFCSGVAGFLESWMVGDLGYTRILQKKKFREKEYFSFSLECLDPGIATKEVFSQIHTAILMSGTLTQTAMYGEILGIPNADSLVLKTPFPAKNKISLVAPDVTTKYSARNSDQFSKIGKYIVKAANKVPGNVGIFFPSYFVQNKIYELVWRSIDKPVLMERQGMSKSEKFEMFEEYKKHSKKGAILFGVVGANFAEGVDFPGNLMNAVVLVGLPLERPDLLTESLINYYDVKFKKGWEYGYTYPAMNRAMQAAGRCIRSEKDRGLILFLDSRYLWPNYKKLILEEYTPTASKDIDQEIGDFFKNKNTIMGFS